MNEIEIDLEHAGTVRHGSSREPPRRDVVRHVPGVIGPRRLREPYLADDLRPQVQRRIGILPVRERKFRPWFDRRELRAGWGHHRSLLPDVISIAGLCIFSITRPARGCPRDHMMISIRTTRRPLNSSELFSLTSFSKDTGDAGSNYYCIYGCFEGGAYTKDSSRSTNPNLSGRDYAARSESYKSDRRDISDHDAPIVLSLLGICVICYFIGKSFAL